MKRWLLLIVVAVVVSLFFSLGLDQRLNLAGLKASLDQIQAWHAAAPVATAIAFFTLYVVVTALSLPGATVMTLAGGALFGFGWGVVIVSFASSLGATLAFLVSRHLLRDWVQRRFGQRLSAINAGIEQDGALYLFTLRLVPLFPFFVINLLMGLTPLRPWIFYWVSQIGMLAGTLVYVNAGTQLARVDSLSGILSPALWVSFALLGLFPLVAKRIANRVQRHRVFAAWQRPKKFDRNLIVIGAGAAGLVSAYIAAAVKAKVTLIEVGKMGGDCLNQGCVPSKALIRSATLAHQVRHGDRYGLTARKPQINFRDLMARVNAVIRAIEPHDSSERYTALGVEVLEGYARIIDPWTVAVTSSDNCTRRLTTRAIVIATGARPTVPRLPGLESIGYLTSDTLWDAFATLDQPPRRLILLGGGPIGCELAQSFARLGSQVTQIEMLSRLLVREDEEVSALARESLEADGVTVLTGHPAVRCERDGERKFLVVAADTGERRIEFDALICAVGRSPRLTGYGLEALGIATERTLATNEYLETLYPNILAAGDVAGPYQFTHTAAHQAWYASVNGLFGELKKFKADYSVIPAVTFIDPEVARVGLNEQEARAQGMAYEVTRYSLADLDRAIADSATAGFVKVLTVPGKDRILGATIVGARAGDLLAEFTLAMKNDLGLNKILATIHVYPTFAEANKYAAGEWRRAHAPQRLLAWVERYHTWKRG
ncbi:MAG: FAD-dependent oxidoreductase [Porticoccaceae bacterium]